MGGEGGLVSGAARVGGGPFSRRPGGGILALFLLLPTPPVRRAAITSILLTIIFLLTALLFARQPDPRGLSFCCILTLPPRGVNSTARSGAGVRLAPSSASLPSRLHMYVDHLSHPLLSP